MRSAPAAPSRIVLTADVNAAVSEDARLLGLLPGPRHLYLGVPLMQGLSQAQLRAILAHELGHYSNSDTRLSALNMRGRAQVLRTITHFEQRADRTAAREQAKQEKKNAKAEAKGKKTKEIDTGGAGITYRAMAQLYIGYAKLYFRALLSVSRRQEYAADAAAARIAGRDATASALREIPVLDGAFDFYMNCYATLGTGQELLPPRGEMFGGYGRMLSARRLELMEMRGELPTGPSSPYDSHPPMVDRVRRIEELPDDGRADEARGAALHLLTDPQRTLTELEDTVLTEEVRRFRRTARLAGAARPGDGGVVPRGQHPAAPGVRRVHRGAADAVRGARSDRGRTAVAAGEATAAVGRGRRCAGPGVP